LKRLELADDTDPGPVHQELVGDAIHGSREHIDALNAGWRCGNIVHEQHAIAGAYPEMLVELEAGRERGFAEECFSVGVAGCFEGRADRLRRRGGDRGLCYSVLAGNRASAR